MIIAGNYNVLEINLTLLSLYYYFYYYHQALYNFYQVFVCLKIKYMLRP